MKPSSIMVSATAIVAGVGGGAVAYQAVSSAPETVAVAKTTDHQDPAPQVRQAGVRFRFAPCKAPAKRVGQACVIDEVQTVVIPASTSSGGTESHPVSTQSHRGPRGHEETDDDPAQTHEGDDDDEAEESEHEDEDHGDEPGDDSENEHDDD